MTSLNTYQQSNPLPQSATAPAKSFLGDNVVNPVKQAFTSGVNQAVSGYNQATNAYKNPGFMGKLGGLTGGMSDMILGAGGALASPLAPVVQRPINAATNAVSGTVANAVSGNPELQNFAMSPVGKATQGAVQGISTGAGLVGTVAGGMALGEGLGNIWEKAYGNPSLAEATAGREATGASAVSNLGDMQQQVGQFKTGLGENFKAGAAEIEKANPTARLELTSDQIDALNKLKDNKSFSLPDYLKVGKGKGVGYTPKDLGEIENLYKLTPTKAQDLITQLNKSTFTEKASGLGVDQTKIGLTNEIKDAAKGVFGDKWSKIYSDYAKGQTAVEKISDFINLDKDATATDINKSLGSVLKLGDTPEGKVILQNAVDEFKKTSGIDLTQGTQAIQQILEKQSALDEASKPGFMKQIFNPVYLGKAAVRYGTIYLGLRALTKALQGK